MREELGLIGAAGLRVANQSVSRWAGIETSTIGRQPTDVRNANGGCSRPVAIALLDDRLALARLCDELGGGFRVVECSSAFSLGRMVARCQPVVLIVGPQGVGGERVAPLVRRIRRSWPWLPIVVYMRMAAPSTDGLLAMYGAGVSAVAFEQAGDVCAHVREATARAANRMLAARVRQALRNVLPERTLAVLECCLQEGQRELTVLRVARELGVHRKTVASWLKHDRSPPASELVAWACVFRAASALSGSARPADHIAMDLGFASGTAMRNLLRKRLGRRPRELRTGDGMETAVEAFRAYYALHVESQHDAKQRGGIAVQEL